VHFAVAAGLALLAGAAFVRVVWVRAAAARVAAPRDDARSQQPAARGWFRALRRTHRAQGHRVAWIVPGAAVALIVLAAAMLADGFDELLLAVSLPHRPDAGLDVVEMAFGAALFASAARLLRPRAGAGVLDPILERMTGVLRRLRPTPPG